MYLMPTDTDVALTTQIDIARLMQSLVLCPNMAPPSQMKTKRGSALSHQDAGTYWLISVNSKIEISVQYVLRKENNLGIVFFFLFKSIEEKITTKKGRSEKAQRKS